jgi:hypothetical protein
MMKVNDRFRRKSSERARRGLSESLGWRAQSNVELKLVSSTARAEEKGTEGESGRAAAVFSSGERAPSARPPLSATEEVDSA